MKTAAAIFGLLVYASTFVRADGFPFDESTQQVMSDSIRIRLAQDQVERISAIGKLELTAAQLTLVRRFYPKASQTQAVVAATFNDNREAGDENEVHVFWVAAEEIAITLNAKVLASEELREAALSEPGNPYPADLRISPNGQIYLEGKKTSLREAFEWIDRKSGKVEQVYVCVAPPYWRGHGRWREDPNGVSVEASDLERSVAETFTVLRKYGEARKVMVGKCW
jgi:hypothetical protein